MRPQRGCKSTLLKLLAARRRPGKGNDGPRTAQVVDGESQEPDLEASRTVLGAVTEGSAKRLNLLRRFTAVSEALGGGTKRRESGSHGPAGRAWAPAGRLDQCQAWDLEASSAWSCSTGSAIQDVAATGRQSLRRIRKRLALASALVAEPDVLLLEVNATQPISMPVHRVGAGISWRLERCPGAGFTPDRYFPSIGSTAGSSEVDRGERAATPPTTPPTCRTKADEEAAEAATAAKFTREHCGGSWMAQRGPPGRRHEAESPDPTIEACAEAPTSAARPRGPASASAPQPAGSASGRSRRERVDRRTGRGERSPAAGVQLRTSAPKETGPGSSARTGSAIPASSI